MRTLQYNVIIVVLSVRINERKQKDVDQCKKLAYLVDMHTISIGMVLDNSL